MQSVVKAFLIPMGLCCLSVFLRTVLELSLYLEGSWLVWLIGIVFVSCLGICLVDGPEWTIPGR